MILADRTSGRCQVGCPIRRFRDQRVLSPPPDLSQSATSFIASYRQGIDQTPFSRLIRSRRRKTVSLERPPAMAALSDIGHLRDDLGQCCLTWKDMCRAQRIPGARKPGGIRAAHISHISSRCQKDPKGPNELARTMARSRSCGRWWVWPIARSGYAARTIHEEIPPTPDNASEASSGGCGRTRTSDLTLIRRTL